MRLTLISAALAATALVLSSGCQSISDSVTSPSRWLADSSEAIADSSKASADSSNAFSDSISGSSSPKDEQPEPEARYRQDVRVAARAWGASGSSSDAFARELGQVAARHGLVDWQARASTFAAVAAGLREAGLSPSEVDARLGELGARAATAEGSLDPTL